MKARGVWLLLMVVYGTACIFADGRCMLRMDGATASAAGSGGCRRALQQMEVNSMRELLGAFKRSISSDPLGILDSWDVDSPSANPCRDRWAGLICDDDDADPATPPKLISIRLSNMRLEGTLPASLTFLPFASLASLDLSQNNLTFPPNLSSLIPPSLRLLNLSYTSMAGAHRPLSRLLNLTSQALQQVWLDSTQLTGSLAKQLAEMELGRRFPALKALSLSRNSLSGKLSEAAEQLWRSELSLQHVDLSHNNLSGTLESWCGGGVSNLSASLTYLDVSNNLLQGAIPASLANCSALQHLDLSDNVGLRGTLPVALPLSCRNLTFFSVVDVFALSGALPPQFALLSRLESLQLEGNNFSGEPLPVLLNCSALRTIHFYGNVFKGRIPADLGDRLPKLQDVVLGNNSFSGPLPLSLANCSFTNLMLGFNRFSGSIPGELLGIWGGHLQRQLDLQYNSFTGSIPPQIGNLTNLVRLILNNNRLSGSFPKEIGLLASLEGATFKHNSFSGIFPAQIFNCTKLQHLLIYDNYFHGPLPSSIGKVTELSFLEAQNNLLSGSLPAGLANCTKLQNFSLGGNQLTGSIPPYLASLSTILFLFDLSHNNFSGAIPVSFGQMTLMQHLDLSNNKLSGPVPPELSLCVGLLSLNLSFNSLSGNIPSSLGADLRSLQQLDLSTNELEGSIPVTLSTAPALVFVNLSYNDLQGEVPNEESGVFRSATAEWFLGNPRLCGEIIHRTCRTGDRSVLAGKAAMAWLIVGSVLLVLVTAAASLVVYYRQRRKRSPPPSSPKSNLMKLQLHQIQEATNNFGKENLIGQGASGSVYKGVLPNGQVLAFKKFTMESNSLNTFFRELETIRQIKHRNLVKALGYWSNHMENNILILEYMENGSLEDHLHHISKEPRSCKLSWKERWNIAMVIVEGLIYLHEDCPNSPIIHCDIKPSNILFDADMQAHISDFGLARILVDLATSTQNLHGTFGYMAPECANFGQISPKCDVYSFGILVLEMMSGIGPYDDAILDENMSLVEWIKSKVGLGLVHEVLDKTMVLEYEKSLEHAKEMELLLNVALECTEKIAKDRPTIKQVLTRLHGSSNMSKESSQENLSFFSSEGSSHKN